MTATVEAPARTDDVPAPLRRAPRWPLGLALLPFLLVAVARAGSFAEGDTFWSVRAGGDVLARGSILLPDTYSWTVPGRVWHPNGWLWDVLAHLAWSAAGGPGLALYVAAWVTAVGVATVAAGLRLGARPVALGVVTAVSTPLLVGWLSARPQTATYTLLPVVLLVAAATVGARGRRFAAGLAVLVALDALWVDLHAAALAGVATTAGGLGLLLLVRRREWRSLLPRAAAVGTAVLAGCCASPLGTEVLRSALHTRNSSTGLITEWYPLWQSTPTLWSTEAVAALGLLALVLLHRRRRDPLLVVWAGALAVLLVMGLSAVRFAPMALLLAVPALAAWAAGTRWDRGWPARAAVAVAAGFAVVLAGLAVQALPDLGRPTPVLFPDRATVEAVPDGCRVLNEYNDGGWITLLRQQDGVRVAADGRNDVYGVEVIRWTQALLDGDGGGLAALDAAGVDCLLLDPGRPVVAEARAAGWRQLAADRNRVLLVRP